MRGVVTVAPAGPAGCLLALAGTLDTITSWSGSRSSWGVEVGLGLGLGCWHTIGTGTTQTGMGTGTGTPHPTGERLQGLIGGILVGRGAAVGPIVAIGEGSMVPQV